MTPKEFNKYMNQQFDLMIDRLCKKQEGTKQK